MKTIYISGESLQGESYRLFISYLLEKANLFSYEVLKSFDVINDVEDEEYFKNILESEKIFKGFYKKKNMDEGSNLKSFVYLSNPIVKKYLKSAESIFHWNYPYDIENLCFYRDDNCIFESITHENYFLFHPENEKEIEKIKEFGVDFI